MRKKTFAAATLLAVASLTLSACGSGPGDSGEPVAVVSEEAGAQKAATVLDKPFEKKLLHTVRGVGYVLRDEEASA